MDAIVLTGGRGGRMGTLTENVPKACLVYQGQTLVERAITSLQETDAFRKVWVVTGYLGKLVEEAVCARFDHELNRGSIEVVHTPHLSGSLAREQYLLQNYISSDGYFARGIDVEVPSSMLQQLMQRARGTDKHEVIMPVSALTHVAPSHPHLQLSAVDEVIEYIPRPLLINHIATAQWFSAIGMRVCKGNAVRALRSTAFHQGSTFADFVLQAMSQNMPLLGHVFRESWRHFAVPADLQVETKRVY